jgi:hypothetical protein
LGWKTGGHNIVGLPAEVAGPGGQEEARRHFMQQNRSELKRENPIKTALKLLLIALIFIVALPFLIPGFVLEIWLRFKFRQMALHDGKFILLVYSDSPIWKDYFEQGILPRVQDHTVILNWSERRQWKNWSWGVQAFRHWGGRKDFNPMAIVFCNLRTIRIFRFYKAFQDHKRGNTAALQKVEGEFLGLVATETEGRGRKRGF